MFQLDDRWNGLTAHILDRILVTQPVGALDGVIGMPTPVVLAHVAQCGRDATLCRYRMAAGGEDFRDAGGGKPCVGQPARGAQSFPSIQQGEGARTTGGTLVRGHKQA